MDHGLNMAANIYALGSSNYRHPRALSDSGRCAAAWRSRDLNHGRGGVTHLAIYSLNTSSGSSFPTPSPSSPRPGSALTAIVGTAPCDHVRRHRRDHFREVTRRLPWFRIDVRNGRDQKIQSETPSPVDPASMSAEGKPVVPRPAASGTTLVGICGHVVLLLPVFHPLFGWYSRNGFPSGCSL